jgi:hypothetical protein
MACIARHAKQRNYDAWKWQPAVAPATVPHAIEPHLIHPAE